MTKQLISCCCLFFILIAILPSCTPRKIISSGTSQHSAPGFQTDPRTDLEKGMRYLASTHPGEAGRESAWHSVVIGATQLGQYAMAEQKLRTWRQEIPTAPQRWSWNQANAHLLLEQQGAQDYSRYLLNLVRRTDLEWTTRSAAGEELTTYFWGIGQYALAYDALSVQYQAAPDDAARQTLEATALNRSDGLSEHELQTLLESTLDVNPGLFPWNMVSWSLSLKHLGHDPSSWPTIWPVLSSIARNSRLANADFFSANLSALEKKYGIIQQNQVLLLPLSGPFAKIGWKVAKGADCAWREGRTVSNTPKIKLINTESPRFLDDLGALCAQGKFPVIGGPLRKDIWLKIVQAGFAQKARFFTFLPSMENEGVDGWRFQSGPEDQTRALLKTAQELGIDACAIMHPQDRFGLTMTGIFQETAHRSGMAVARVRPYDMNTPSGWIKAVADVLQTNPHDKNRMNPEPEFQALFIPDSFSRAKQLIPFFRYFEETRTLFLGPQIWSQSMKDEHVDPETFALTLFPNSWDPTSTNPTVVRLQQAMVESSSGEPDLWAALGYDFVRFTQLITKEARQSAQDLNLALEHISSRMNWSIAPLHWHNGQATQDMFLFQLASDGMQRANLATMRMIMEQRQILRAQRAAQLRN